MLNVSSLDEKSHEEEEEEKRRASAVFSNCTSQLFKYGEVGFQ